MVYQDIKSKFPQLTEHALIEEIILNGTLMNLKEGTVLIEYGSFIKFVPLLLNGSIKVMREGVDGNELLLYFLESGDTCSMSFSCCMSNKTSDIKAIAEEDSQLVAIPIQLIDQWISKYPTWKNFILQSYDKRMQELIKTVDNIAFNKLDRRLEKYLYKKSAIHSNTFESTHQQIAIDLNASREAVSRLLKKMENDGLLLLGRNKITILD